MRISVSGRDIPCDWYFISNPQCQRQLLMNAPVVRDVAGRIVVTGRGKEHRGNDLRGLVGATKKQTGKFMASAGDRGRQSSLGAVEDVTAVGARQVKSERLEPAISPA